MASARANYSVLGGVLVLAGCQTVPGETSPSETAILTYSFTAPLGRESSHIEAAQEVNGASEICVVSVDASVFHSLNLLVEQTRSRVPLADLPRPTGMAVDQDGDGRFQPILATIMDSTIFRIASAAGAAVAFAGSYNVRAVDGGLYELPYADWLRANRIALMAILDAGCPEDHDTIRQRLERG